MIMIIISVAVVIRNILIDQSVIIVDVAALLTMRPLWSTNVLNVICCMIIILNVILNTCIIVVIIYSYL